MGVITWGLGHSWGPRGSPWWAACRRPRAGGGVSVVAGHLLGLQPSPQPVGAILVPPGWASAGTSACAWTLPSRRRGRERSATVALCGPFSGMGLPSIRAPTAPVLRTLIGSDLKRPNFQWTTALDSDEATVFSGKVPDVGEEAALSSQARRDVGGRLERPGRTQTLTLLVARLGHMAHRPPAGPAGVTQPGPHWSTLGAAAGRPHPPRPGQDSTQTTSLLYLSPP